MHSCGQHQRRKAVKPVADALNMQVIELVIIIVNVITVNMYIFQMLISLGGNIRYMMKRNTA